MPPFKKLQGPYGIPIYFQQLGDPVKSVSMSWTVFVGGADDESVGAPGLYHWFEHVPFRGTKNYPGGYKEIKGLCTRNGGSMNAWTDPLCTTYHATVPTRIWKETLAVITDLLANPLIKDDAVAAEREIIVQEITQRRSTPGGLLWHEHLLNLLYPGHPCGHHVLGTPESLASMSAQTLRDAHAKNYDRSRCVFFASGNIEEADLLKELAVVAKEIPARGLPKSHVVRNYGPVPEWKPGRTEIQTEFDASLVTFLLPLPQKLDLQTWLDLGVLGSLVSYGGLDSPLFRILRDERKLVYHADLMEFIFPGGGFYGLGAETNSKNIDAVLQAFKDVFNDPVLYSEERIRTIQTGIRGGIEIKPINPANFRSSGLQRLKEIGHVYSDEELLAHLDSITPARVREILAHIDIEKARVIVLRGK
ncbi:MAG TPA: pitrilysin family protein [Candidatus Paceibacterota bacterium]